MEPSTGWLVFFTIFFVMTISSAVHGAVGYGINIMAGPILALFEPRLAPGPLLVAGFALTLLVLLRDGRTADLRSLSWLVVGRILGTIAATLALTALTGKAIPIVFGVLVLVAVWMSYSGLRLNLTRPVKIAAGTVSGIMGTLAALGGPPVALIYQDKHGSELRATLSAFFVFGTILSLGAIFSAGKFGKLEWELSLQLLPGVLAGFLLSPLLIHHLDRQRTRQAVLAISALAGAILIIQTILK